MASVAFAAPILAGKVDECRTWANQVMGARRDEQTRSRKRMGVTRETCWVQSTPGGRMMMVVLFEADDVVQANADIARSQEPYDVWFKQAVESFTGLDFSKPARAMPETIVDWRA